MNASGVWRGHCNGRIGHFKFINIEVIPDQRMQNNSNKIVNRNIPNNTIVGGGPTTVDDLLLRIGLKEYTSVFVLNG